VFTVSTHPPAEVIVVTGDPDWTSEHPAHVVVDPSAGRAHAAAANLGAASATGAWLLFASDAAEVVEPDWLSRLMVHAALPGVAAVGPLIVRPDGRTEAAGFAVGLDDPVTPMLAEVEAEADGYYGALACARDVSALSGDFMLVRTAAFRELGGFEENYLSGFADFDLCQQLRAAGNTIVYAPQPRVVVHETPAGRREALDVVDRALYVDRWYDKLKRGDPYFNRNFATSDANFVTDR
jgi:GT2 family glycosyltransferase